MAAAERERERERERDKERVTCVFFKFQKKNPAQCSSSSSSSSLSTPPPYPSSASSPCVTMTTSGNCFQTIISTSPSPSAASASFNSPACSTWTQLYKFIYLFFSLFELDSNCFSYQEKNGNCRKNEQQYNQSSCDENIPPEKRLGGRHLSPILLPSSFFFLGLFVQDAPMTRVQRRFVPRDGRL